MLPNLLCIGAQKSGTTSIWHILDAHPDVCMARPRETRFFSDAQRFGEGPGNYEMQSFGHWSGQAAVGEKCPEYLFEPSAPQRIRSTLGPDVRLLIALRSPAQRAHAHYRHNRAMLRECRSFEAAIAAEISAEAGGTPVATPYCYLARGRYAEQVRRYLEIFSATQLLFVSFESEIESDQRALARRLYRFLRIAPFKPAGLPFRSGHPPLGKVSIDYDASHPDSNRHYVEIQRPGKTRRWAPSRLLGVRTSSRTVERVYRPSASLRKFAEHFATTATPAARLSRSRELELNNRYFRADVERLRALVPFDVEHWFAESPIPPSQALSLSQRLVGSARNMANGLKEYLGTP